jgi:hypothetical protein
MEAMMRFVDAEVQKLHELISLERKARMDAETNVLRVIEDQFVKVGQEIEVTREEGGADGAGGEKRAAADGGESHQSARRDVQQVEPRVSKLERRRGGGTDVI